MSSVSDAGAAPATGLFGTFCLSSYLLSLSYGTTFLLARMLSAHGGSESDAGSVISVAMLSTFIAVIFSGHLTDLMGAPRAIAAGALFLAGACLGSRWRRVSAPRCCCSACCSGLAGGCSTHWGRSSLR